MLFFYSLFAYKYIYITELIIPPQATNPLLKRVFNFYI